MNNAGGKKKNYKYCIVTGCRSTTVKTPNKTFITVPRALKLRKKWQQSIKREKKLTAKSTYYVCEDHFNLETDVENYMYFKSMDNVPIKMRPGSVPHIFNYEKNKIVASNLDHREFKRQLQTTFEELQPSTSKMSRGENRCETVSTKDPGSLDDFTKIAQCTKNIQVNIKPVMLSKETQCNIDEYFKETT